MTADIRTCIAMVEASLPRRRPRDVSEPLRSLSSAIDRLEKGEPNEVSGLDELLADLAGIGPKPSQSVRSAIDALVFYARVLDGDETWLEHARAAVIAAMAPPPPQPTVESLRARIQALTPGDDAALTELAGLVSEHQMRELAGLVFDKLELDDSKRVPSFALRDLQRAFAPKHQVDFASLCIGRLASPSPATRRWAAHGMQSIELGPEHVPLLAPLLHDDSPLIRNEAATALRMCVAWHPQTKDEIRALAEAADATRPGDRAIAQLLTATRR